MPKPKDAVLQVRLSDIELVAIKSAAEELDVSVSDFVRRWMKHAVERDVRGRLLHK